MDRDQAVTLFHKQNSSTWLDPARTRLKYAESTFARVGLRPTGLSSPALQTRPPALTIVEKWISSFPDANSLKKDGKEQTCHSREPQAEIETASASNG